MIEILGHELISFEYNPENYNGNWNERYDTFKCNKCNTYIFYYKLECFYWHFSKGGLYSTISGKFIKLELTCDEMIIKRMLE